MPHEFVHLHVHSEYSMLDGAQTIAEAVEEASRLGQRALGMTDHGNLNGANDFHKRATAAGVKPIIGAEFYVNPTQTGVRSPVYYGTPEQRREDVSGGGAYTHLTVLAANVRGLAEMFRLQRDSYLDVYYKPRISRERLARNPHDLIILSGCASGELATRLRLGQLDEADEVADWYKQVFGDRFYVELMYHGEPWMRTLVGQLIEVAKRHNIPTVATNDAHYARSQDAPLHRAMLCIQTGTTLARPGMEFSGHGYFLRSAEEMATLGLPEASLACTLAIAERVESYDAAFAGPVQFPEYPLPEGWTAPEALRFLTERGLQQKVPRARFAEYWREAEPQLKVIIDAGFAHYFLVNWHLISEGRKEGVRIGPGRGSAAGSIVTWALDITQLDPIEHGLISERFLNPQRLSHPDIDNDLAASHRERFLRSAVRLYGESRVVQIGTYGTFAAKRALLDSARVHGLPASDGAAYAARLPRAKFGRSPALSEYQGERDRVVDLAIQIEGRKRSEGIHPAGVGIAPEGVDVGSRMPLRRPGGDGPWVTGYVDTEVERFLVKMDFLGLRNLDILEYCLAHLRAKGIEVDLPTSPAMMNDRKTYELLSRGDTLGCFQLDGYQMRRLLRRIKPDVFADIRAVLALFRPGPMGANAHLLYADRKNEGSGEWRDRWAVHPEVSEALRPVLSETYGLIVYQEQVLQALNVLCGWSYAEADNLLNAMRKKNHQKMAATRPDYEKAGMERGYSLDALTALWEVLVPFADYSFNKAHAAAYGVVAYWTAYLKANHPVEYMAATLTSVADDADRLPEYLAECRRMGLSILPPSINGGGSFSPGKDGIHYGLLAIKGVGQSVYDAIRQSRGNMPFSSLRDFMLRSDPRALSAGTLRALIQSGALDELTPYREELYLAQQDLATKAMYHRAELAFGQRTLLEPTFLVWDRGAHDPGLRRQWEEEALGVSLTPEEAVVRLTRRLAESEMWWLRKVFDSHPGDTAISLVTGHRRMAALHGDWEKIKVALRGFDGVELSAP